MISQPPSARQQPHIMPVLAVIDNINFAMPHFDGLHALFSSAFAVATPVLTDHGVHAAQPGRIRSRDPADGSSTWHGHTQGMVKVRRERQTSY